MSKPKSHNPAGWANDAATDRIMRGTARVAQYHGHRPESAKPKRMTTTESSRAIAKELRRNSRSNGR